MNHSSTDYLRAPRRQWWLVVVCGALTLVCGALGLLKYDREHSACLSQGTSPAYHAVQMLILHGPHLDKGVNRWIEAGRWFGVMTVAIGTVTIFWWRLRRELRLLQLKFWDGHFVICGVESKSLGVLHCRKGNDPAARVVLIDPQIAPNDAAFCEAQGMCVIAGDAAEPAVLEQARAAQASRIVVVTPEDETNVRIAATVRDVCANRPGCRGLSCRVHLIDNDLREELQKWCEVGRPTSKGCTLTFFDVFDDEARRVLLDPPIDGQGIGPREDRSVHVVILGFGRMGRSIALRAAKMGHFANRKKLRLSIIDRNADQGRERFLFRYPVLDKGEICELNFHQLQTESLEARRLIEEWADASNTMLHVFQCLDSDARNLEVGLRLRTLLTGRNHCTLRIRFRSRRSLARILGDATTAAGVIPFGMVENAWVDDAFGNEAVDRLARVIHSRFVKRREAGSRRSAQNDPTLRAWDDLPEEIRESNRQQADHIGIKLRAIGCDMVAVSDPREAVTRFSSDEVEWMAEMEHRRWRAERWLAGWRYGTPSDKTRRISENLGAWGELHDSIKRYDEESVEDIPMLAGLSHPPQKVVRLRPGKNP